MTKEKDVTQKTLEAYNDIFSDIVNVLLFDGRQVVDPDELTDATTYSQYKLDGIVRGQERDVAKYWRNGKIQIAMIGLENQTDSDPDMPLRIIGYDGAAYRDQMNRDKSGKKRERYPVITLVLYFGHESRWGKPLSLKECFSIPEGMEDYVQNYRINLFEIAYLDRETVDKFTSDFWILADYCWQMRTKGRYDVPAGTMTHPREVLQTLQALTRDPRIGEKLRPTDTQEEGLMPVKSFVDDYIARGEAIGRARGEAIGQARGEAIGRASADTIGQQKMSDLYFALKNDGRLEDYEAALQDQHKREAFFRKYGIASAPETPADPDPNPAPQSTSSPGAGSFQSEAE